ncbi:MAG: hypothetical protein AAGA39_08255, partial [Pseudomonadota bacterium]
MKASWTEDEVAAFVDGSLEEPRASEIEAILAEDTAAQAIAMEIQRSNELAKAAFADILEQPVPASLKATVLGEPDKVTPLRPQTLPKWRNLAMAAGFALAVGIGGGLWITSEPPTQRITTGIVTESDPLFTALETLPSGERTADGIVPMLSFLDDQQRYCREFERAEHLPETLEMGIACRGKDGGWHVEIVITASLAAAHGWFNRMLRRPLRKLGWVCVYDGGDKYWSYRV